MIYLLDPDELSIDLVKISREIQNKDGLVIQFCNNAVYYENGLPKLNLEYIKDFKFNNPEIFDLVMRLTNTRIV